MKLSLFFISLLLVSCNGGGGGGGGSSVAISYWDISGLVTYQFVPATATGLDYAGTTELPMRNVIVQILRSSDNVVLGSGSTDDNGNYLVKIPQGSQNTSIKVSARAEMTSPSVIIQDNTNSNAKYVATGPVNVIFGDTVISTLIAPSGWGGNSYTSTRAAAPFAILDSIYTAIKKVKEARPSTVLPALKVNWSTLNVATSGDLTIGQIGTSHFNQNGQLYILGKENSDTDEYDRHVIAHEWGHYFEDKLSRSDSGGGQHSDGEVVDMSLAFGEGWGNALSGIVFSPDINYRDTAGVKQQVTAIDYSLETSPDTTPGWFSEVSVQQIIFDIFDSNADAGDSVSLGLGPILDVFTGYQKTTPAKTSIFSFITGLKNNNASSVAALNTLTTSKQISNVANAFGTGETNNGGLARMLPIYNQLVVNGGPVTVFMGGGSVRMNEADNNRYFRFTATSTSTKLTWASSDTYILSVSRLGSTIYDDLEQAPDGNILGPYFDFVTTTPGLEYVLQISTHPDFVFDSASPVEFAAKIE
ncbi:MAG: hypothetical protein V4598_16555 [Bdellovibrionota bacterium]